MREQVGIVLQQCGVQPDLSVRELVEMYGRYHLRRRPVDEVIELVELTEKRDARAKELSGGQRRRLDLALALVGDPELIFLDEPTTGFDPAARRAAWSTIRSLCELGKTVFLTTHFMDEAQHLADRVAIMRGGEIVAPGRPDELGGRDVRPAEIRFTLPVGLALHDVPELPCELRALDTPLGAQAGERAVVLTRQPVRAAHILTGWALDGELELDPLLRRAAEARGHQQRPGRAARAGVRRARAPGGRRAGRRRVPAGGARPGSRGAGGRNVEGARMIRVLIAEDQGMVRGALASLIGLEPGIEVVAQVGRGDEVLAAALDVRPDVALLDIEMPGATGLDAAEQLSAQLPACRVLILTTFGRPGYLRRAMEGGAAGFVL